VLLNLGAGTVAKPLWESLDEYQQNRLLVFVDPSEGPARRRLQRAPVAGRDRQRRPVGKGSCTARRNDWRSCRSSTPIYLCRDRGRDGFVFGTLVVIGAYGVILWRLVKLSERLPDPFAGIVVFGIFGAWFTHIMVNIGMTVGIMPVTGIPLPFLSYGGSFLLATYLALGVAQRVASEQGRI
jgi:rod shape determining protein RodA